MRQLRGNLSEIKSDHTSESALRGETSHMHSLWENFLSMIREPTLERNLINAITVGKLSAKVQTLSHTKTFTSERGPMHMTGVRKLLPE